jgi:hypothetical protein
VVNSKTSVTRVMEADVVEAEAHAEEEEEADAHADIKYV